MTVTTTVTKGTGGLGGSRSEYEYPLMYRMTCFDSSRPYVEQLWVSSTIVRACRFVVGADMGKCGSFLSQ